MKDTSRKALPLLGNDRPAWLDLLEADRRPDVLVALLFDLVAVPIGRLPRTQAPGELNLLHDWFRMAGLVLDLLPTEDKRQIWGEMVAEHIVQEFPKTTGGLAGCRQQLACMRTHGRRWWEAWKREHASVPPKATTTQVSGPSEHEA